MGGGQGEEEGLSQPTQRPLQGRTAQGLADLVTGNLSQDGAHMRLVLRHLLL